MHSTTTLAASFVAKPLQSAALELVASPGFTRHLRRLQATLGTRMQSACAWAEAIHPGVRVTA